MPRTLVIAAASVLAIHGLIHLMGTTVYMRLGDLEGLRYKTTVLNGRWDLGARGIFVFGALWTAPAAGFLLASIAWLAGWDWWRPVLLGTTVMSLALTGLDWNVAFMGAITNVVILALLALGPRLAGLR